MTRTLRAVPKVTSNQSAPKKRAWRWRVLLPLIGLIPLFVVLGIFHYYPALSGIYHSLFDWRPGFTSTFTGFENYRRMFADEQFWASFRVLAVIFVAHVTVMWVLPLLASELLITLRSKRLRSAFRILLLAPMAFPSVVTALVWAFFYEPNDGVINRLLREIGLGSLAHNWVGQPDTAIYALIMIGFPWIAGLPFLVFLSTLQNVPGELFEAASIDGAGRIRRFWSIDLPLIGREVRLLFVLALISTLQYGFAAYLVTGGGPDNATQVPVLLMLNAAFGEQSWGYAATLSTTLFVITVTLSVVALLLSRRKEKDRDVRGL